MTKTVVICGPTQLGDFRVELHDYVESFLFVPMPAQDYEPGVHPWVCTVPHIYVDSGRRTSEGLPLWIRDNSVCT